jgi:hypothetical protein
MISTIIAILEEYGSHRKQWPHTSAGMEHGSTSKAKSFLSLEPQTPHEQGIMSDQNRGQKRLKTEKKADLSPETLVKLPGSKEDHLENHKP